MATALCHTSAGSQSWSSSCSMSAQRKLRVGGFAAAAISASRGAAEKAKAAKAQAVLAKSDGLNWATCCAVKFVSASAAIAPMMCASLTAKVANAHTVFDKSWAGKSSKLASASSSAIACTTGDLFTDSCAKDQTMSATCCVLSFGSAPRKSAAEAMASRKGKWPLDNSAHAQARSARSGGCYFFTAAADTSARCAISHS
mmetsp:Transcript_32029/g.44689  ORF Transcript_32029/g.44689 Transcript_32029/m.44689 type:complete len:200 (+) Transcript_32029:424-1023(+)